jgi:hypothetical protein
MLKITIELVPFGNDDETQPIATMLIANEGTSRDYRVGNYAYVYNYADRPDDPEFGYVKRYSRNDGAWGLVKKCLNDKYHASSNDTVEHLLERLERYTQEYDDDTVTLNLKKYSYPVIDPLKEYYK